MDSLIVDSIRVTGNAGTGFTPAQLTAWSSAILTAAGTAFGLWWQYIKKPKIDESANQAKVAMVYQKDEHENLITHSIFNNLLKYRRMVVTEFQIGNNVKMEVYKDILVNKLDVWHELLFDLAEYLDNKCDGTCNCVSASELKKLNSDVLNTGIHRYNSFFMNQSYTPGEQDLITYALVKLNEMHRPHVEMVELSIEQIDNLFDFTKCPRVVQAMVFNVYCAAFVMAFRDMRTVIEKSNGYFDGKEFKRRSYGISTVSFEA